MTPPALPKTPDLPLDPKGFLLYPANNWPHKNHEALLRALVWLKKERNLEVPVVFTGTQLADGYPLQQKIDEFGLSAQCSLFGYLTTEEMAYLYLRARGLIFPSLFEGFGLPLVEAMAAGCPVLSSDAASLPEIGETPWLIFLRILPGRSVKPSSNSGTTRTYAGN